MNGSLLPLSLNRKTPLEVATQAAYQAGKLLVDRFISPKTIIYKGKGNIATEVDTLSEQIILDILKNEFPDFKVLSEETNSSAGVDGYTWIVDPLDGTNNYVFGVPNFCINVALSYDDDIIMGITYDPLRNEMFHSEKAKEPSLIIRRFKFHMLHYLRTHCWHLIWVTVKKKAKRCSGVLISFGAAFIVFV